ncbi:YxD-tail cyclophane-containing RiPP peptide [Streptomyces monomycini]|uniref:YxD-tail cyclophane-containing RiPP peptide n=1 Tax=Streptomyces monomycini TaxID=371720 RepID=UPI001EEC4B09|nr:YxD-tail cyclophane-containing RiPP peptide [Streptomyces monomycini]
MTKTCLPVEPPSIEPPTAEALPAEPLPVNRSDARLPDFAALPLGELSARTEHPVLSALLPGVRERMDSSDVVAFYDDAPPE